MYNVITKNEEIQEYQSQQIEDADARVKFQYKIKDRRVFIDINEYKKEKKWLEKYCFKYDTYTLDSSRKEKHQLRDRRRTNSILLSENSGDNTKV